MNNVFLEIGGNLGDKLKNINIAKELINNNIGQIIKKSSIYETPPWGFECNNNFYNQVLQIQTTLTAKAVLKQCNDIENKLGRVRGKQQFTSRTMDIDILLFNNEVIDEEPILKVPHPRIHLRKFVLIPLNDINPQLIHPLFNKSIQQLLSECTDNSQCIKIE